MKAASHSAGTRLAFCVGAYANAGIAWMGGAGACGGAGARTALATRGDDVGGFGGRRAGWPGGHCPVCCTGRWTLCQPHGAAGAECVTLCWAGKCAALRRQLICCIAASVPATGTVARRQARLPVMPVRMAELSHWMGEVTPERSPSDAHPMENAESVLVMSDMFDWTDCDRGRP